MSNRRFRLNTISILAAVSSYEQLLSVSMALSSWSSAMSSIFVRSAANGNCGSCNDDPPDRTARLTQPARSSLALDHNGLHAAAQRLVYESTGQCAVWTQMRHAVTRCVKCPLLYRRHHCTCDDVFDRTACRISPLKLQFSSLFVCGLMTLFLFVYFSVLRWQS